MQQLLDNLKNTIELSSDEEGDNNVKPLPEAFYPPVMNLPRQTTLQDILTNDNQNSDTLNEIRSIRDTINTEVGEISSPLPPDDFPGDFDNTEFYPPQPPVNPFGNATAPPLNNDPPPPYPFPSAPPYPEPPDYDDVFPTEPVPVIQVPILSSTEEESSEDENPPPPPPPDLRLIYTLVPPEINIDDVNDPGNLIWQSQCKCYFAAITRRPKFPTSC